jgi:hypothetical protein
VTIVLNIALALSIISFAPSAAAFTPMIFMSGLAALIALAGIWQGHYRRGLLTIFFAVGAAIVSPIVFGVEPVDRWLIALPVIGATVAAVMYWKYRRHQNRSH